MDTAVFFFGIGRVSDDNQVVKYQQKSSNNGC